MSSDIMSQSIPYPETDKGANLFSTGKVRGEIELNNWMLYDSDRKTFKKGFDRNFEVRVGLWEEDNTEKSKWLSNITGLLLVGNRTIKPITITYGVGNCFVDRLLERKASYSNHKSIYSETFMVGKFPKGSCIILEYPEFVGAEQKFSLEIGEIIGGDKTSKISFEFEPMAIRQSSH